MTVYLDATALVALHTATPAAAVVSAALADDPNWVSSALTLTEALALIDRVTDNEHDRADLEDLVRLTWDRIAIVPVDQRCLDDASNILRGQPLRISDALHLGAAARLPSPVRWVTFDAAHIPVAISCGYDVISS